MNKTEFVQKFAEANELSKKNAAEYVNSVLSIIADSLKNGESVAFPGFGSFEVKERAARTGVNPRTKEEIQIAASKLPVFKAGKQLKDSVSGKA